jgi:hypothetical protein
MLRSIARGVEGYVYLPKFPGVPVVSPSVWQTTLAPLAEDPLTPTDRDEGGGSSTIDPEAVPWFAAVLHLH